MPNSWSRQTNNRAMAGAHSSSQTTANRAPLFEPLSGLLDSHERAQPASTSASPATAAG